MAEPDHSAGVVLGDIGGTNVRFAVLMGGVLGPVAHMAVAGHRQFGDALEAFLATQAERASIRGALFGVAGVVERERCALTNNPWVVDAADLRAQFGFGDIHLVNDFEAVAWSLPRLKGRDLVKLGGGEPKAGAPMVVIGPGTGLGVAAYVPGERGGFVMRSEGGHSTLPGGSPREDAIIEALRQRFGHVSAERALSGPGLENLYRAIASLEGQSPPERTAAEISKAALAGQCPLCLAALDAFCAMFGTVAGNFALSFGAEGGVYIAGGIAAHIRDHLARSQFRSRFEAKGRMRRFVEPIPVYVIVHDDPAFLGLQALAGRRTQMLRDPL